MSSPIIAPAGSVTNKRSLIDKIKTALSSNNTDVNQDNTVIAQANALASTTGSRTTAQLSDDIRKLAQAISILAKNDVNSKKELNALIRIVAEQLASIENT